MTKSRTEYLGSGFMKTWNVTWILLSITGPWDIRYRGVVAWGLLRTSDNQPTLVSRMVQHIEISEHPRQNLQKKVIVGHLYYTVSIATNKSTPSMFFSLCKWSNANNQIRLMIRDTGVCFESEHLYGLMQKRGNFISAALGLHLFCINP